MTPTNDAPVTVEQIKPCPFCASPGKMIHPMGIWAAEYARPGHSGGYGPDGSRIVCTSEECSGCGRAFYGPDQDAEAIGQWNTRLAALASAPAGDGAVAGKVLDDIVPLSIASTWDDAERRNIIRAMQEYAALARPRAAVGERPDDETLDPHLPDTVKSERRCGIQRSDWMTSWFVPWSPRNDNQNAEGPWSHWVALAHAIIAADEKAILALRGSPAKAEG